MSRKYPNLLLVRENNERCQIEGQLKLHVCITVISVCALCRRSQLVIHDTCEKDTCSTIAFVRAWSWCSTLLLGCPVVTVRLWLWAFDIRIPEITLGVPNSWKRPGMFYYISVETPLYSLLLTKNYLWQANECFQLMKKVRCVPSLFILPLWSGC